MDGVPHLTQKPIGPGETFAYAFHLPAAGTYWYHAHQRSFEQVGRGLYSALIVEEREPILVDCEVDWVLVDWPLRDEVAATDDIDNRPDINTARRLRTHITATSSTRQTHAANAREH